VTGDADVVVVGGGINGVAAVRAVARAGLDGLLLEQYELGNTHGSSHGGSRIFRLSYPDPEYGRLSLDALTVWRELEHESGTRLIEHTGSLDFGADAAAIEGTFGELEAAFDVLEQDEVAARWGLVTEPGTHHLFQADGGFFFADRALAALAESARRAGAELSEGEQATELVTDGAGVIVRTSRREIVTRAVVVAAGPWARGLLATVDVDLPVVETRETVVYFHTPEPERLPALVEYPSAASPLPTGQAYYALPAPGRGLKVGVHHAGRPADPRTEGAPDDAIVEASCAWVRRRWPDIDPSPLTAETCFYTNTADARFVIGRHGRVVVVSACSGHGFKFAPVTGERAARLAREAAAA
jgi:sarcosine oxidase